MRRTLTLAAALAVSLTASAIPAASALASPAPPAATLAGVAAATDIASMTAALEAANPDEKLTATRTYKWVDGTTYTQYKRTWRGLPVVGGDFTVPMSAGSAYGVTKGAAIGRAPVRATSTAASIPADQARTKGRSLASAEVGPKEALRPSTSNLVVFVGTEGVGRLAWDVYTESTDDVTGMAKIHTYLDAETGAVLGRTNLVQAGTDTGNGQRNGTVRFSVKSDGTGLVLGDSVGNEARDLKHADAYGTNFWSLGNPIRRTDNGDDIWGSGTLYSGDKQAVDAQFGMETAYAYYLNTFGRRGQNNDAKGMPIRVHAGSSRGDGVLNGCWSNATWDGWHVNIGDGPGCSYPFTSIDILGHELTHGVTWNSAELAYELESGGLNESMSDIFGTMIERYAHLKGLTSVGTWNYKIGEQVFTNPIRYMDKPSRDGASLDCWSPRIAQRDASGNPLLDVHNTSGPMNHAFYLLAEGSGTKTINGTTYTSTTCNGSSVAGIGPDAAARIVYAALTGPGVPETATYAQFRNALVVAAKSVYGQSSRQCLAVEQAMSGINVPASSARCLQDAFNRDLNGDGFAENAVVNGNYLKLFRWTAAGTRIGPTSVAVPWRSATRVRYAGNWDGEGSADYIVQTGTTLRVYPRYGTSWGTPRQVGSVWNIADFIVPGDLDGNGLVDIYAVTTSADLVVYLRTSGYSFKGPFVLGKSFLPTRQLIAPGDFNNDGKVDLLRVNGTGGLVAYYGDGKGGLSGVKVIGSGWQIFNQITSAGDTYGDDRPDLLGILPDGTLRMYRGCGTSLCSAVTVYKTTAGSPAVH